MSDSPFAKLLLAIDVDALAGHHPRHGYEITADRRLNPVRYTATARNTSARLYCVITNDLAELADLLADAGGPE